ncbi:flagellar brake protein [Brevibacillus migulae]|uniref:flagellar brake protein n=1 Tax=Brevibacillus migulae TaxID=1644114 RepID=UPI001F40BE5E|nr:flagellar brake domain-containing protein [Brevibacillus migulae]
MSVLPRIGQLLRIKKVSMDENISKPTYKSRVADIQGEQVAIEMPIQEETGKMSQFPIGTHIEVSYFAEDGSTYQFQTEVEGEQKENVRLLLMRLPEKEALTRMQRRNYLRVETHVEIAVKTMDNVRNYHFLARTTDLSGGGMAFTCPDHYRLKVGDKLEVWMALPHKAGVISHSYAEAEVTRCKLPEEKGEHQWVSLKFVTISQADQAKVIRACYERQLELRKKGMGE